MVGENSVEESMFSSYRSTCIWDKPFIERLLASFEPPKAESGSDEYVYDPMKPLIPYPSELLIFNSPFSCRAISRGAVSAIAQPLVRSIM
jgi:hypothetical protein